MQTAIVVSDKMASEVIATTSVLSSTNSLVGFFFQNKRNKCVLYFPHTGLLMDDENLKDLYENFLSTVGNDINGIVKESFRTYVETCMLVHTRSTERGNTRCFEISKQVGIPVREILCEYEETKESLILQSPSDFYRDEIVSNLLALKFASKLANERYMFNRKLVTPTNETEIRSRYVVILLALKCIRQLSFVAQCQFSNSDGPIRSRESINLDRMLVADMVDNPSEPSILGRFMFNFEACETSITRFELNKNNRGSINSFFTSALSKLVTFWRKEMRQAVMCFIQDFTSGNNCKDSSYYASNHAKNCQSMLQDVLDSWNIIEPFTNADARSYTSSIRDFIIALR